MFDKNRVKILIGVAFVGLVVVGFVYLQAFDSADLEGHWNCQSSWSWDNKGVSVPCSSEQQGSCIDGVLSVTGVTSIGDAQWSETIEGTCHASEEELFGTRSLTETVPKNDAAREFERERFGGRSLASVSPESYRNYRSRITSLTETQLKGIDHEGRPFTCDRP